MDNVFETGESSREIIKDKLRQHFDGKIVRKDLTKKIKEGANVPVYVLEFLLGQYCSSDDDEVIEQGVQNVKRILADNFVRPDEAQKILSRLRSRGSHTVIDMITVNLNMRDNIYQADFSNLGIRGIPIADEYPEKYDRLLCGGIWCIVQLNYEYVEEEKKNGTPIRITKLTPIQMPHIDIEDLKQGRQAFTKEEWLDVMLRSIGMEPDELSYREKWLLLTRMIPLVENNFNLCELGPRSTGKSHLYKEISPNSILVSGGQTTVANLFYNMGRKTVGLVGLWDCVAFDEVAGIKFKDKDGVQIMKDYMASGSFARGKEEKAASASMVFVGNINQSVDVLLKTSSLFDPFPPEMGTDTAFLDRIHCYLPGWEIPKFRPEHFTNDYGFISDYLAEFIRELRKEQYGDAIAPKNFVSAGIVNGVSIMIPKKIEPIPNAELYPILFNLIKYFTCADEDATGPNEKVNDIFLNQLKNITQASTLQKKSIKRFVNEIFYEGHEKIRLNPQSSNKKATILFYSVYLIGLSQEICLDDRILQKILKEGLECAADAEFIVDDEMENKLKNIMMSDKNYSDVLEKGAEKVKNWQN